MKYSIPRTAYWLKNAGIRKTTNMLMVEIERTLRRTHLMGKPYYYFIDPCNYCNLHCPLCASGAGTHLRQKSLLRLADYEVLLEKIAPYAVTIALHNWGEPLLNPELYKMIRLTSDRRIQTVVSTNLSLDQERLGEEIVSSGLKRLTVSLDGVSQVTYQKYRRGGNIELVFSNIQQVVLAKKLSGLKTPIIEWQFLVFKHNEHEIPLAHKMARELGVDRIICRSANFPYDHYSPENTNLLEDEAALWMPSNPKYWEMHPNIYNLQGYLWKGACHFLYRGMSIAPDGDVSPCCYDASNRRDFGNVQSEPLAEIWNRSEYQRSRGLFGRSPVNTTGTICEKCSLFQRSTGTRGSHDHRSV